MFLNVFMLINNSISMSDFNVICFDLFFDDKWIEIP